MRNIKLYNGVSIRGISGEISNYPEIRSALDQANKNRAEVILATLVIEGLLDDLITKKVAPETIGGVSFLNDYLLKSDMVTFASKRKLVLHVIKDDALLDSDETDEFGRILQKIMGWRNAFAHGEIMQDGEKTCVEYGQVGPQRIELIDDYWSEVESTFSKAFALHLLVEQNRARQALSPPNKSLKLTPNRARASQ